MKLKKNTNLTVKNSCKKIYIRYATILRYVYRQVKTSSNQIKIEEIKQNSLINGLVIYIIIGFYSYFFYQ